MPPHLKIRWIVTYPVDGIRATAESRHSFGRNAQTGLDAPAKLVSRVTPIISKAGFMGRA
jgi:hypothetical protein